MIIIRDCIAKNPNRVLVLDYANLTQWQIEINLH